jgi:cell wall-associated NlpC family hydrolase
MANRVTGRRSVAVIGFCLTLAGCMLEEPGESALLGEEHESIASISQALSSCAPSATFKFSTSGDVTTARIGGTEVAWFTEGAYTVRMLGPLRTFVAGPSLPVTTTMWVRTLPAPFDLAATASTDLGSWLDAARAENCATGTPDLLDIAFEYTEGAPKDAAYEFGADFHDYLGIDWDPPDADLIAANPAQLGKLDCSGYVRLVFGERVNFVHDGTNARIPLSKEARAGSIPRTSRDQYHSGPGKILVPFRTEPRGAPPFHGEPTPKELDAIQVGDLVFFDTSCDYTAEAPSCGADWSTISHIGLYVGQDALGDRRFLSSRIVADGPTVADTGGASIFNPTHGATHAYPMWFRAARRF